MSYKILVINPGGSGIKVSVFEDEKEISKFSVKYPGQDNKELIDQCGQLAIEILGAVKDKIKLTQVNAVISRGTTFYPLKFGVYPIKEIMISDLLEGKVQTPHVSNISPIVAYEIEQILKIPCYIADPISVEQGFLPEAKITGWPTIERKCLFHALNIRYVALQFANEIGRDLSELNLILAHLGTGFSVCALAGGNILDANNANDGGPLSLQRAGDLPITALVELCEKKIKEGKTGKEIISALTKNSGVLGHLGTDKLQEVEKMITSGDKNAELIIRTMAYQIGKEIGSMAATLKGNVNGIIITGGCAHSKYLLNLINPWIEWISPCIYIVPGEGEMEALAAAALRVLRGQETPKEYIGWDTYYKKEAE